MNAIRILPMRQAGFTMIEVLVALLIIVLGLLGLAGLQTRLQQAEFESYQRSQAGVLLYDIVDRISYNRATARCFAISNATSGAGYYGTGSQPLPGCAKSITEHQTLANAAMADWDSALKGAAEKKGTASVGAIVGARGCVSYDATTELPDSLGVALSDTGIYTVTVSWQGDVDTVAPTANCGNTLYGAETRRRAISTTFRLAKLS